mmetsp:Transcript_55801/g.153478  ORF Transcript_55801/g.153478 Transcript_55801/m.153478 type:complete len:264 (-) Transcript_55801:262-1053(-)
MQESQCTPDLRRGKGRLQLDRTLAVGGGICKVPQLKERCGPVREQARHIVRCSALRGRRGQRMTKPRARLAVFLVRSQPLGGRPAPAHVALLAGVVNARAQRGSRRDELLVCAGALAVRSVRSRCPGWHRRRRWMVGRVRAGVRTTRRHARPRAAGGRVPLVRAGRDVRLCARHLAFVGRQRRGRRAVRRAVQRRRRTRRPGRGRGRMSPLNLAAARPPHIRELGMPQRQSETLVARGDRILVTAERAQSARVAIVRFDLRRL